MDFASHWQIQRGLDFLNHGSFGATPTVVLDEQRSIINALEADPIRFLAPERDLEPRIDAVRQLLAELFHTPAGTLAFVRNATDGVNAVFRSFPFQPGDRILVTDHGYNACINAARFAAEQFNRARSLDEDDEESIRVDVANIPFPITSAAQVVEAVTSKFRDRTRILLIDHVTSPTGLVLPVREIIAAAHARGIRVLVDGAHAPGMLPLNLTELDADYYTANHHKWLCGPKVSGFLYVRPELQAEVRPTVISHAANRPRPGRSRFLAEFDWTGTFDPSPLLALPRAVQFLSGLYEGGLPQLMAENHRKAIAARDLLCRALNIPAPAPDEMLGSLVAIPIGPDIAPEPFAHQLYHDHRFELPVLRSPCDSRTTLLRVALQAYNRLEQVERLAHTITTLTAR